MTHAYAFDKGILLDNISQLSLGPRTRYLHSAVALIVPCTRTAVFGLLCQDRSQACTAGQPLQVALGVICEPMSRISVSGGGTLCGPVSTPCCTAGTRQEVCLLGSCFMQCKRKALPL